MKIVTLEGKLANYCFDTNSTFAEGGTGKIYKGWVTVSFCSFLKPDTPVAIKVLYRDLTNDIVNIVREESATKIHIDHPNILRMYEFVEVKKRFHSISEWLDGETLEQKQNHFRDSQRKIPIKDIERALDAYLNALECLHSRIPAIIHRDIKPGNLMFCSDSSIKLIDFGAVKMQREYNKPYTVYGTILGTPAYCAPEQIKGYSDKINPSTDIYALGNTLFELFEGYPPFTGDQYSLMEMQVHQPLAEERCANIPEPFRHIILKSTQKKQEDRFQLVREIREHMEKYAITENKKPHQEALPVVEAKNDIQKKALKYVVYSSVFTGALFFLSLIIFQIYIIYKELSKHKETETIICNSQVIKGDSLLAIQNTKGACDCYKLAQEVCSDNQAVAEKIKNHCK